MSKRSDNVKRWRENTKKRIVESFGGCCCKCNYNKCNDALELHHLDPAIKEFGIGHIMAHIISWKRICEELKKCIMVCSNCHKEIHANIWEIPDNVRRFDESYIIYKEEKQTDEYDKCPVCGNDKIKHQKTCSTICRDQFRSKYDWSKYDLINLIDVEHKTYDAIAESIGCTYHAVAKRYKKLKRI